MIYVEIMVSASKFTEKINIPREMEDLSDA